MLGIGLSLTGRLRSSVSIFSPVSLFSSNEPGIWLDPSDVANLAWRRNLLTFTEQFDNAVWLKFRGSITATNVTDPLGGSTADTFTGSDTDANLRQVLTSVTSPYVFSVWLRVPSGTLNTNIYLTTASGVVATTNVNLTTDWQRFQVTGSFTTGGEVRAQVGGANTINSGQSVNLWGAQLELGSVATDYQRISDVNTEVIERFPSATLYQDTAGTTPVTTPGQTVALALDKSKGLVLGSELVTNGDFATDTWWQKSASVTISGGAAVFTSTPGGSGVFQTNLLTVGKFYSVTYSVVSITSGAGFRVWTDGVIRTAVGTYTEIYRASSTSFGVLVATTATTGSIDNISVKELPGFHATQATLASRPTYGIVPLGGRRNLLTYSEDLTNAVWGKTRIAVSGTKFSADSTADTSHSIQFNGLTYSGVQSTVSFDASAAEISLLFVQMGSAAIAGFNLSTGAITSYSLGSPTTTITSLGSGLYRCTVTATPNSNSLIFFLGEGDGSTLDVTLAGVRTGQGLNLNRAQLETGSSATAYQRVGSAFDVTEAGVASLSYLFFGGDTAPADPRWMVTPTITPGIDKAQVFAGVRKLSDAAAGTIAEMSAAFFANNGSFALFAAGSTAPTGFEVVSRGTANALAGAASAAPVTNVLAGIGDISGDRATLRINGTQVAQSTADQGAGNYLAYQLFIGRRAGTSLGFNGQIYSLIVRFGTNLDAGTITSTETWVNGKTGAYT